eukprot:scaffold74371_cov69-Phaeocystis_antarctica.AAC.1
MRAGGGTRNEYLPTWMTAWYINSSGGRLTIASTTVSNGSYTMTPDPLSRRWKDASSAGKQFGSSGQGR